MNKRTIKTPNDFEAKGDYSLMNLYGRNGEWKCRTKIDNEDIERISKYKWSLVRTGVQRRKYVQGNVNGDRTARLHTFLMGKKDGLCIDHINGDGLDNRKKNLRHATYSENASNRRSDGVSYDKNTDKWQVHIEINGKQIYLGEFKIADEARKVRREALILAYRDDYKVVHRNCISKDEVNRSFISKEEVEKLLKGAYNDWFVNNVIQDVNKGMVNSFLSQLNQLIRE